jgi:hypothetical protein
MFSDVSYVFPQKRSQDPSRRTQERMWHAGCHWMSPPCYHSWSPTKVTKHHNHLVLIMSHVTADSIVQTVSWFLPSIIRNVQIFLEVSAKIIDWISPTLLLTRTRPGLPFSLIRRNPRGNLTRISPYTVKSDLNLTCQPTLKATLTTNPIVNQPYPILNLMPNLSPNLTQSPP